MNNPQSFQELLFETAVREGTESFQTLLKKYAEEKFYGICLYTNNDLRGVYPFANSVQGLKRRGLDDEEKWIPAEWDLKFEEGNTEQMEETTSLLVVASNEYAEQSDQATEKYGDRSQFKAETIKTLSRALLAIREAGLFREQAIHDRIAFWVHIGDSDGEERKLMFAPVVEHLDKGDVKELRELFEFE